MQRETLRWVWTVFGPVQVAVVWGAMEGAQGWPDLSPFSPFFESEPANAAAAIIAVSILGGLLLWVAGYYARSYGGKRWASRLPLIAKIEDDTGSLPMRLFQGVCALLFLIGPALALIHFWHELLTRGWLAGEAQRERLTADFFGLSMNGVLRLHEHAEELGPKGGFIEWIPILSGAALLALTLFCLWRAMITVRLVLFRRPD